VYSVYKYYENLYPVNEAFMFMSNPDEHYTREILMQNSMGNYQQAHIKTKQEFTDAIKYFRPHTVSTQKKTKTHNFFKIYGGAFYHSEASNYRQFKREVNITLKIINEVVAHI